MKAPGSHLHLLALSFPFAVVLGIVLRTKRRVLALAPSSSPPSQRPPSPSWKAEEPCDGQIEPTKVTYDPVTGIPSEYNAFMPKDSNAHKKWRAHLSGTKCSQGDRKTEDLFSCKGESLATTKQKSSGKGIGEILLEKCTRKFKRLATLVSGLESFGISLDEAKRVFSKKFACSCTVLKVAQNPSQKQIIVQGDVVSEMATFLCEIYADKGVNYHNVFHKQNNRKTAILPP